MLALFACTKDLTEVATPNQEQLGSNITGFASVAAKGTLAVKLSPEAAQHALTLQTRSGAPATRSGLQSVDKVLDDIEALSFERIIEYDPEWEAEYSATGLNRWYAVTFDKSLDVAQVAKSLANKEGIVCVEMPIAGQYRKASATGPMRPMTDEDVLVGTSKTRAEMTANDALAHNQWHYHNTGYKGFPAVAGADVNAVDAWELCAGETNGHDVVVAVMDQPVYTEHPDLKANMWSDPENPKLHGYNFWNQSEKLDWKSHEGKEYADHGSHVAGTIAAVTNNKVGVAGIAGGRDGQGGNVKIMSCQILGYGKDNNDPYADSKAFTYALKKGAVISQNSWGYNFPDPSVTPELVEKWWESGQYDDMSLLKDAIETFVKFAGTKDPNSPIQGGLVLFSAGNSGDKNQGGKCYPAADKNVIAVSSMDWAYRPAYYTDYGTWVDITAPGGDWTTGKHTDGKIYNNAEILSTVLCDSSMSYDDNRKNDSKYYGYGYMQGTSMSCPHVSGVAALGLAYASKLGRKFTADEYRALLLSSVNGIDQYFVGEKKVDWGATITTLAMDDYKNKMGGGLVDALKLLLAIKGTPANYVKLNETVTLDLSKYFGGADSKITIVSVESNDLDKIGVDGKLTANGGKLTFTCKKEGAAMLNITAKAGDMEFKREIAVVSRANLASNGGWL